MTSAPNLYTPENMVMFELGTKLQQVSAQVKHES